MAQKPSNIDLQTYNNLVNGIYDAAMDTSLWPQLLEKLAGAFNAHSGLLRTQDLHKKEVGIHLSHGMNPSFQRLYTEHFIHLDSLTPTVAKHSPGIAMQSESLMPPSFRNTEYFNDYMRPQGSEHVIGGIIERNDTRIVVIGMHRRDAVGPYYQHELDTLQLLFPHLQRAIDINRHLFHLTSQVKASSNLLDRLAVGVILVDRSGTPFFINNKAEAIISSNRGVKASKAGVQLERHEDTQTLQRLMYNASHATLKTGGVLNVSTTSLSQPLSILVTPVNKDNSFDFGINISQISAALFIDTKETPTHSFSIEIISELYGLTYAEARLAAALSNGHSLDEIAAQFNLSKGTLRSQLKSCFQKTELNRQADLVKLIISGPGALVNDTDLIKTGK